jgi:hypothetical protein
MATMLPKHVRAVKNWLNDDGLIKRPNLDDWALELLIMMNTQQLASGQTEQLLQ